MRGARTPEPTLGEMGAEASTAVAPANEEGLRDWPAGPAKAVRADVISVNAPATGHIQARAYRQPSLGATVLGVDAELIQPTRSPCLSATSRRDDQIVVLGYLYDPTEAPRAAAG